MNTASFLAILYADVFNYPLKKEEREKWQIKFRSWKLETRSLKLPFKIKDGYYCLCGREHLIKLRQQRQKYSQEKLFLAQKVSHILKFIPFVKLIAVTGALAVENSPQNDDIDLLIITKKNRVWLTRLLSIIFLEILGKRRRPKDKIIKDKICLNMFLDENNLEVPQKERNLYVGHEVAQIRPLFNKDYTYEKFLLNNKWVKEYLPNIIDTRILGYYDTRCNKKAHNILISQYRNIIDILELLAYKLQYFYMKKRLTRETVEKGRIMFHPRDTSQWVLKEFDKRVKIYYH